ncbi:hypothetical protein NXS19_014103 [Fusarium pseudograminearum]|nr:hypothetical protein NXS19_014103 [Fusarium pseudograminearum]
MQGCLSIPALRRLGHRRLIDYLPKSSQRLYSFQSHERISVRCGSAGFVNIDLIDIAKQPNSPLFIYLPPPLQTTASSLQYLGSFRGSRSLLSTTDGISVIVKIPIMSGQRPFTIPISPIGG